MQLKSFVGLALLAIKVTASPNPEAGDDLEARDFSGETLTELDARDLEDLDARDEDEDLFARDEDDDLVARGLHKCGWGAYPSKDTCKCWKKSQKYDTKAKKCYTPLECKGKNVKVEGYGYGNEKCVCTLDNQEYNEHKGCVCVDGYTWSWKEKKCVKDCEHGQKYDHEHGCYTPCVGKWVEEEWTGYPPSLTCVCKNEHQVYDSIKGCHYKCPDGAKYDWHKKACKCEKPGYIIKNDQCVPKCDKPNTTYYHGKCVCKEGYFDRKGQCVEKPECGYGSYFDKHSWSCKCYKKSEKYDGDKCVPKCDKPNTTYHHGKCVCKEGYFDRKGQCVEKPECGYGSYFDKHSWSCKCYKKSDKYEGGKCVPRCSGDASYNWHTKECECKHGKTYIEGKGCVKECKAPATLHYGQCKCPGDQKYSDDKGCYCPWGEKYSSEHEKCYKPCHKPGQVLVWKHGYAKCVCKKGWKTTKWGCEKEKYGGHY